MLEKHENKKSVQIHRIYIKNISFETPNVPQIFQRYWDPKIKLHINTTSSQILDNMYQVILCITVTATISTDTAFLCEVQQGGIFSLNNIQKKYQIEHILGSYCPNLLFPYARECISNLIWRGTFPSLHLEPIDFESFFLKNTPEPTNTESSQDR
ncbi:protein-export chaperone SecB [Candidatus Erwinia haradaeae]|uniref:Protein-export protein SecB n=1 Tax=Candidatus Erwinia haradaeae TaxID=1922217 RepID=A0A451D1L8_9GAMM|nr:protein-export chaperone SecB [Candidatus Erwinia haradaeae]VFP79499.1 Protein-export protein SecB [Candidatus Erwinia haradaeae]